MNLYKSRFTPGVAATEIRLDIDEVVHYKLLNGKVVDALIKSKKMRHYSNDEILGYEAIIFGESELSFIDEKRIVLWEGKVEQ